MNQLVFHASRNVTRPGGRVAVVSLHRRDDVRVPSARRRDLVTLIEDIGGETRVSVRERSTGSRVSSVHFDADRDTDNESTKKMVAFVFQ